MYYLFTCCLNFWFVLNTYCVYNIEELTRRLMHDWNGMDQSVIDNAIDVWIQANNGYMSNHYDSVNINSAM